LRRRARDDLLDLRLQRERRIEREIKERNQLLDEEFEKRTTALLHDYTEEEKKIAIEKVFKREV